MMLKIRGLYNDSSQQALLTLSDVYAKDQPSNNYLYNDFDEFEMFE